MDNYEIESKNRPSCFEDQQEDNQKEDRYADLSMDEFKKFIFNEDISEKGDFTDAQWKAVTTKNKTILLSAAAGSGKTKTLTERVIHAIINPDNPCEVSRLLILTYTISSAHDLKSKVSHAICRSIENISNVKEHAKGEKLALCERLLNHLNRQMLLLPSANIGTIDSFCNRIAKEFSRECRLPIGYRITDAGTEEHLQRTVMNRLLDGLFSGKFANRVCSGQEFCHFAGNLVESKTYELLADKLLSIYRKVESYTEGPKILGVFANEANDIAENNIAIEKTSVGKVLIFRLNEYFKPVYEKARNLVDENRILSPQLEEKLWKPLAADLPLLEELSQSSITYKRAKEILDNPFPSESFTLISRNSKPFQENPTICNEAMLLRAAYLEKRKALVSETDKNKKDGVNVPVFFATEEDWYRAAKMHAREVTVLAKTIELYAEKLASEKRRAKAASFADVERAVQNLVRGEDGEQTTAGKSIAGRFDQIYIDEYQDINKIQHNIFTCISNERNLFTVGDIKQSIYGFRQADPSLFKANREAYKQNNGIPDAANMAILLSDNFRCDKSVIDITNAVFRKLFGVWGDSIGYKLDVSGKSEDDLNFMKKKPNGYKEVKPVIAAFKKRTKRKGSGSDPQNVTDGNGEDQAADSSNAKKDERAPEVEWIASEIERLLALTKNGEEKGTGKRYAPSDIAVLFRKKNKKMADLQKALEEKHIPSSVGTRSNFFDSPEIELALCLLNAVNNPYRDIYFVGLLCSPLFMFTADELYEIRHADFIRECPHLFADSPMFDLLREYNNRHPDFAKGRFAYETIARYNRASEGVPVSSLIMRMFIETGLFSISGRQNKQGHDQLNMFFQYARAFEKTNMKGLFRFIDFVNDLKAAGTKWELEPPVNGDGVKIMTIHGSKGLEFGVVFIAGTDSQLCPPKRNQDSLFHPDLGFAGRLQDDSGSFLFDNPFRAVAKYDADYRDKEEEMRVLYVALTRAKERLYITASFTSESECVNPKNSHLETASLYSSKYYAPSYFMRSDVTEENSYFSWMIHSLGVEAGYADIMIDPDLYPDENRIASVLSNGYEDSEDEKERKRLEKERKLKELTGDISNRFHRATADCDVIRIVDKSSVSVLTNLVMENGKLVPPRIAPPDPKKESRKPALFMPNGIQVPEPKERGTKTHLFLQMCILSNLAAEDGVKNEIARMREKHLMMPEDIDMIIVEEIEAFVKTDLFKEMCTIPRHRIRREFRFSMILQPDEFTEGFDVGDKIKERNLLVQGVFDSVYMNDKGEIVVVDYKTDRIKGGPDASERDIEKFKRRHIEQLFFYYRGIGKVFGSYPEHVILYSLCMRKEIDITDDIRCMMEKLDKSETELPARPNRKPGEPLEFIISA